MSSRAPEAGSPTPPSPKGSSCAPQRCRRGSRRIRSWWMPPSSPPPPLQNRDVGAADRQQRMRQSPHPPATDRTGTRGLGHTGSPLSRLGTAVYDTSRPADHAEYLRGYPGGGVEVAKGHQRRTAGGHLVGRLPRDWSLTPWSPVHRALSLRPHYRPTFYQPNCNGSARFLWIRRINACSLERSLFFRRYRLQCKVLPR